MSRGTKCAIGCFKSLGTASVCFVILPLTTEPLYSVHSISKLLKIKERTATIKQKFSTPILTKIFLKKMHKKGKLK